MPKFSQSVDNSNIIVLEDIEKTVDVTNEDNENLVFTLGFTAGIRDLNKSQIIPYINVIQDMDNDFLASEIDESVYTNRGVGNRGKGNCPPPLFY